MDHHFLILSCWKSASPVLLLTPTLLPEQPMLVGEVRTHKSNLITCRKTEWIDLIWEQEIWFACSLKKAWCLYRMFGCTQLQNTSVLFPFSRAPLNTPVYLGQSGICLLLDCQSIKATVKKNAILRLLFRDSFFFSLQVLVFVPRCSHLAAFSKCGWALIKNRKFQPSNLAELRFFF